MSKFIIEGGARLRGVIKIGGAKNSAVALLPAAILSDKGDVVIENLPDIDDIKNLQKTLQYIHCKIENLSSNVIKIKQTDSVKCNVLNEEIKKMRASYYLIGALLTKMGHVKIFFPGGCSIGTRPIDLHLKGFKALGATINLEHGIISVDAPNGLKGANIYLDTVSVGATINLMLAAVKASGVTILQNTAKEPHIVDVANFLNKMGADIEGAGSDTIKIKGVKELKGCHYSVVSDQIEAGTYMIAGAATQGDITLTNVNPEYLGPLISKLTEAGVHVEEGKDYIRVTNNNKIRHVDIRTTPYPGFPTDLQQPMSTLLSISQGTSIVSERIWENRFKHIKELNKMGANIKLDNTTAIIEGVNSLSGAEVNATDLRGGAAMVIAGLVAEGETVINDIEHINRGYEDIEGKLKKLGAHIKKED